MKSLLPLILITLLFILFRVGSCIIEGFPVNAAPLSALFFCAVYYAGGKGVAVSVLLWLVSYPLLSVLQGYAVGNDFFTSVLGFSLIIGAAFLLKKHGHNSKWPSSVGLVVGSLTGAVLFYFLTNFTSWLSMPIYEKSWYGLAQAQWLGHPSFPLPTWVFLKNSLLGNATFLLLVLLSQTPFTLRKGMKVYDSVEEEFMGKA